LLKCAETFENVDPMPTLGQEIGREKNVILMKGEETGGRKGGS